MPAVSYLHPGVLDRITHPNGVVFYQSTLLAGVGVPHGFSTRIGGVSDGVFSSLNLGNPNGAPVQDSLDRIARNYQLLQEAIGCAGRERAQVHQVHGCAIEPDHRDQPFDIHKQADGIIGDDPRKVLSVRVADCVPVLLADRSGRRVAAVHAGWRGVALGIVGEAARRFDNPSDLVGAIGPSIGFEAFECGPEVVEAMHARFGPHCPAEMRPDGKGRVDLRGCLRMELIREGVPESQIDTTDRCTVTQADEFFSHRRDKGITGRLAALIGARA